jgi:thiosulfate dehydrogenase [quinone] large subunit
MNGIKLTTAQLIGLVALRISIGWHFLYEGLVKINAPAWSSVGFLKNADWIFAGFFQSLASNPVVLQVVDILNIAGLVAIGIALIAGLLTKPAAYAGFILLLFYYFANPPMPGIEPSAMAEGNYLIINKTLIEGIALFVLAKIPTGVFIGLDRFFVKL